MAGVGIKRTAEQMEAFRAAIADPKKSLRDAMREAGYSEGSCSQGLARVPKALIPLVTARAEKLMLIGRSLNPEQRAEMIRGGLALNMMDRTDKGVRSMELAGKDKEVAMWTQDSMTGIIVVEPGGNLTIGTSASSPELPPDPVRTTLDGKFRLRK
jgi:hypothetical protein